MICIILALEINTFKVRKANFDEIWETSFLLSAFPILIDIQRYLEPLVRLKIKSK